MCNLAELAGGVMTDATIDSGMRWIPKGMSVEHLGRASGPLLATATPGRDAVESTTAYEWPISATLHDARDRPVFRARIAMWVPPRVAR